MTTPRWLIVTLAAAALMRCTPSAMPDVPDASDPVDAAPSDAAPHPDAPRADTTDDTTADAPPAAPCDRPDGGAPCQPGLVACGATDCPTATAFCCITADAGPHCLAAGETCAQATVELRCDEAADCPAGQVCCSGGGLGRAYQTCAAECVAFERQVCRTHGECVGGTGPCTLNDCEGFTVQTCGPLPPSSGCTPR